MNQPHVDIALATYNGSLYIEEFVHSLRAQTHKDFTIYVSDDCSTDGTVALLKRQHDLDFRFVGGQARLGVLRNFERAISACTSDYVLLADQDDIWESTKIERLLAEITEIEAHDPSTPCLVYSDLALIDDRGHSLSTSFFRTTTKKFGADTLAEFALDNHVPGCSYILNRSLVNRALPFPDVEIHDWWLVLVAASQGKIASVGQPLIKYRQHSNNSVGIGDVRSGRIGRLRRLAMAPRTFITKRVRSASVRAKAISANFLALWHRGYCKSSGNSAELAQSILAGDRRKVLKALYNVDSGMRSIDKYLTIFSLSKHNLLGSLDSAGGTR